jgi:hypothetical protein
MEKKYYHKKKRWRGVQRKGVGLRQELHRLLPRRDAANIAINKGLLFPNVGHKCLMAKESKRKKVYSRESPNILLPMMRVALVKRLMICLLFFCKPHHRTKGENQ